MFSWFKKKVEPQFIDGWELASAILITFCDVAEGQGMSKEDCKRWYNEMFDAIGDHPEGGDGLADRLKILCSSYERQD